MFHNYFQSCVSKTVCLIISSEICMAAALSFSHNPVIINDKTIPSDLGNRLYSTLAQIFWPCLKLLFLILFFPLAATTLLPYPM